LIICPKAVISNWKLEFKKWLPQVSLCNLICTKSEREDIVRDVITPGKFDVCLTTFEGVRICMGPLKKWKWEYIIVDEAHKIKNEESIVSQRLRELDSHYRLLLTGTPLQNNLHELWSLLNFLLPDVFSSSEDFDDWFDLGAKKNEDGEETETNEQKETRNKAVITQLHKILRPFMLRRLKKEVEK
jgi:SWI/SNF-related matrix-associated actin-dependent regulator of chromatin subfamily A member 5